MERWDRLEQELKKACPELELRREEPMAGHTSFRIGGPASLMALPKTREEAVTALKAANELGVKPFFLGSGSNLLVADEGYDGLIVRLDGERGAIREADGLMWAGGGAPLPAMAFAALDWGRSGLEFASGIPGSVGGAVVMNAGAYGGEMAQVVRAVVCLDETGREFTLTNGECRFSYRHSVFSERPDWLVVAVGVELPPGDREEIKARMDDFNRRRREKQPLEYPSAGSTFKRPAPLPDGTPVYAAALIDQCGLKGLAVGGAQVSEKHAGFIVNRGGATCADVLALMDEVKHRVLEETGVALEPEVKLLGL